MSVILGVWQLDGAHSCKLQLDRLGAPTGRFAPDGSDTLVSGSVGMKHQLARTSAKTSSSRGVFEDAAGEMIAFEGRLDNRDALAERCCVFGDKLSDAELVVRGFECLHTDVFALMVGDWALAIWCPRDQALYLARDNAGTRTLYYQRSNEQIIFSTYLDTFLAQEPRPALNREFVGGFLACQAVRPEITPFDEISSVPPAHYVRLARHGTHTHRYWEWPHRRGSRAMTDASCEEEFRARFQTAVSRRTNPADLAVAELSGGRDSSSIVCMSDHARRSNGERTLISTVSYYFDGDPDWNERPYFEIVEQRRRQKGIHLPISFARQTHHWTQASWMWCPLPGFDDASVEDASLLRQELGPETHVLISGTGGDELFGGVQAPALELADYLARGSLRAFTRQSLAWAIHLRRPVYGLAFEALLRIVSASVPKNCPRSPAWLVPGLVGRIGTPSMPLRGFLQMPSPRSASATWEKLIASLPHTSHNPVCRYEYRYPYLDRDLVEFLATVPREQLMRPGEQRSLMRRSLRGIVPDEILDRRRKAYLSRGLVTSFARAKQTLEESRDEWSQLPSSEFLDLARLVKSLERAASGDTSESWIALLRAMAFKIWIDECLPRMNRGLPLVESSEVNAAIPEKLPVS